MDADAATNFAVSYVRTRDFRDFRAGDGRRLSAPITFDSADLVEKPGINTGLLNSATLFLAKDRKPVLLYTRYGTERRNAVVVAWPDADGWKTKILAQSSGRTEISGKGSLGEAPRFRANTDGDTAEIFISFPNEKRRRVSLDLATMTETRRRIQERSTALPSLPLLEQAPAKALVRPQFLSVQVKDADNGELVGSLQWLAQASNRDKPYLCGDDGKRGCKPPATALYLVIGGGL
jgi:hypothetical protein